MTILNALQEVKLHFKDHLTQSGPQEDHLEVFAGLQQSVMDYLTQMLEEQKNAVKVQRNCLYRYVKPGTLY